MKVIIDLTALLPQSTGVDKYIKELTLALTAADADNQYLLCLNFEDRQLFENQLPPNFSCGWFSARPRIVRLFFQQVLLPLIAFVWGADVVHSPAFIMPLLRGSAAHALTVHDMTSFSHPECHNALRRSASYLALVRQSIRRATVLLVPSAATRDAIIDLMPEVESDRIFVTPLGIASEFREQNAEKTAKTRGTLGLPQDYILYVGTLEPRKSLPVLVESYARLLANRGCAEHLVIVGKKGWDYDELMERIEAPELRGRVHLTGYLDQQFLPDVYAGARLFVYPSQMEGFGLPPLEAMACGVPTISTRTSSLSENLEGAAELVPVDSVDALTDAMSRLLEDETLRDRCRKSGLELAKHYRWKQTAKETLAGYRAAVELNRRGRAR